MQPGKEGRKEGRKEGVLFACFTQERTQTDTREGDGQTEAGFGRGIAAPAAAVGGCACTTMIHESGHSGRRRAVAYVEQSTWRGVACASGGESGRGRRADKRHA